VWWGLEIEDCARCCGTPKLKRVARRRRKCEEKEGWMWVRLEDMARDAKVSFRDVSGVCSVWRGILGDVVGAVEGV
jgi:hypothetical protein